jgi:hypothetical protein
MIDEVFGVDLAGNFELALVENLIEDASRDSFVLFLLRLELEQSAPEWGRLPPKPARKPGAQTLWLFSWDFSLMEPFTGYRNAPGRSFAEKMAAAFWQPPITKKE